MHIPLDSVEIGILFVNDRRIREMNRHYRGIDRVTDVLSFSQLEEMAESPGQGRMLGVSGMTDVPVPFGDIIIGLHQARRQAKEYGLTLSVEISRLLVHGLLHLIGYDHEKGGPQARTMRAKERELLGVLGITL